MIARRVLTSCFWLCLSAATQASEPEVQTRPGSYIVEFADNSTLESFYGQLAKQQVGVKPLLDLTYELFKGASFELKNPTGSVDNIAKLSTVKTLWPLYLYPSPNVTVVERISPETSNLTRRQQDDYKYTPYLMTQIDKLKAAGYTGKGLKVGIIDNGVNYKHPALGGCFGTGPGCVVSYGRDLIGDDDAGTPDNDPFENTFGHGTSVAGIIAGQRNALGFEGVAPGAKLGMYRISRGGQSPNRADLLIAAWNQAYQDGSHIISSSVNFPGSWPQDPASVTVQRIVEKGVPCIISAGNRGDSPVGLGTVGSLATPATAKGAAAVGSVRNTITPFTHLAASYHVDNGPAVAFTWKEPGKASAPTFGTVSRPLWANTSAIANECRPQPSGTPDLSPYIVLIPVEGDTSNCGLQGKLEAIGTNGAHFVMFYHPDEATLTLSAWANAPGVDIQGIGFVTNSQARKWFDLMREGKKVTLDILAPESTKQVVHEAPSPLGGYMAKSSSWGLSKDLDIKPQFSAPGADILAISLDSSFDVVSGTSFATPLVAGVYALLAEALGTRDPKTLEARLSTTANPNIFHDGRTASKMLAPVPQQGAGLIQAFDAFQTKTLLDTASITFNDTDHLKKSVSIKISNAGAQSVTYTLGNVKAATVYQLQADGTGAKFPPPMVSDGASLTFSPAGPLVIPAGGSASVTITPTPPAGLDAKRLPTWSGYVTLNGTNGDSLSVPYVGVAGSLYSAALIDRDNAMLRDWLVEDEWDGTPTPPDTVFTFPRPTAQVDRNTPHTVSWPELQLLYKILPSFVRVDIVPADASNTVPTKDVLGVKIAGSLNTYPKDLVIDFDYMPFNGMLADETVVPAGRYSFLVRALKTFGDRNKAADYDTMTVGPFAIKYS